MDLSEALYTSLLALKAADSGSSGLTNSSSTANVHQFVLQDDPNLAPERGGYSPSIIVDIREADDQPWILASKFSVLSVVVRMKVLTFRDPGRSIQDDINERIRAVFDGVTPSSQTGWTFGPLMRVQGAQSGTDRTKLSYDHEFVLRATTTANVELIGAQASVTFAGTEGTAIGSTLIGQVTDFKHYEAETWDTTPWSFTGEKSATALWGCALEVAFTAASMTPPVPSGTDAQLILYLNRSASKGWTIKNARVVSIRTRGGGSTPQQIVMTFRGSAASAFTNPVVAA